MKRIVCFLLALIMVLGMIPGTAVTAKATSSRETSASAIDVLRNTEVYYEKPQNNLIGYSTKISDEEAKSYANGISTEKAVALLQAELKELDKAINSFTETNNLNLTQGQHDALAVHIYRTGSDNGLYDAVLAGKTGNDIVKVFVDSRTHKVTSIEALKTTLDISLSEAGMYLYGDYYVNGGSKLTYARLDTDGDLKADEVVGYVKASGYTLKSQGTSTFLGWYVYNETDKKFDGAAITKLDSNTSGKLIVAKQGEDNKNVAADYTINTTSLTNLNVYDGKLEKITGTLKSNTNFKVSYEAMVSGVKWIYGTGKNTDGKEITGWVCLGALTDESETAAKAIATATVTATSLDIYAGATADSEKLGSLAKGTLVKIYEIKVEGTTTGNKNWGKIINVTVDDLVIPYGWINLAYADVDETLGESGEAAGQTGKIVNAETVNIRSSAGITATNKITSLKKGTEVTVLETTMVGSAQWGKIKWEKASDGYTQGWVYMHYVQLDSAPEVDSSSSYDNGSVLYTGVVTSNINLNVRKSADIYSAKVDSLPNGTSINIYEVKTSGNMKWGRIGEDRWVCLTYVSLTEVDQSESGSSSTGTSTVTTLQATVKSTTLDVYKSYNSNSEKVGSLNKGDVVTILERNTENTSTGSRIWGRISTDDVSGWINLAYTEVKTVTSVTGSGSGTSTGTTSSNGADAVIANCISVNIRKGAGVSNAQITKLNSGTKVKVYDRVTKDNAPWAKITWNDGANEGWVCMYYVEMSSTTGSTTTEGGLVNGTNSNTISATGYVNSNIDLNVRGGAGLGYAKIGSLSKGTKVTVYEQVTADGMIWGRITYGTTSGWVCMSYITVESASNTGKGVMGTIARCFAAVNVRSAPGTGNALIGKINVGTRVEVFETKTYSGQLWGRVAQGWICMDYVLLDSELPEGTILDATVPSTDATQSGETTEPDDGLDLTGAVSCSISGTVGANALNIYNEADDESQKVGSISAGKAITIVGVKKVGTEVWGVINQNGTQGWIKLDAGACSFKGYVNTNNQPIYVSASASSAIVNELNAGTEVSISKLGTDGSAVYGWIDAESAWIPVSKLDATKPAVTTYYQDIGTGVFTTATTTAEVAAYKSVSSTEEVFKIAKGYKVSISDIDFVGTKVWGKVVVNDSIEGWINMNSTYFTLSVTTSKEIGVYTDRSESKPLTDKEDETVNITCAAGTALTVRTLNFDSNGNVWAEVIGNANTEINNNYVIIRNGDGTSNVNELG